MKSSKTKPRKSAKAKAKPAGNKVHDALVSSLKGLVAAAELHGERDAPHVQTAKEALALAEKK
jgi:hypothetical protein